MDQFIELSNFQNLSYQSESLNEFCKSADVYMQFGQIVIGYQK